MRLFDAFKETRRRRAAMMLTLVSDADPLAPLAPLCAVARVAACTRRTVNQHSFATMHEVTRGTEACVGKE